MPEIDKFIIPYTTGLCGVREYPNNTFILESADDTPLVLDVMPQIAKSLYDMGFRKFTIVVREGGEFKSVAVEDAWERGEYVPHSPTWERISWPTLNTRAAPRPTRQPGSESPASKLR